MGVVKTIAGGDGRIIIVSCEGVRRRQVGLCSVWAAAWDEAAWQAAHAIMELPRSPLQPLLSQSIHKTNGVPLPTSDFNLISPPNIYKSSKIIQIIPIISPSPPFLPINLPNPNQ
jgi:hypothetical protein